MKKATPTRGGSKKRLTLIAGGDVEWQTAVTPPGIHLDFRDTEGGWPPVPMIDGPKSRAVVRADARAKPSLEANHAACSENFAVDIEDADARAKHPLRRIAPVLRSADVAFCNLEMPLSARASRGGAFRGEPRFAEALRWAGVDLVSLANNHMLDAGELGLVDTLAALDAAGVAAVGAGADLAQARRPHVRTENGVSVGFLAYDQIMSSMGPDGFALPRRAGVAPMDPFLVREDVRRLKRRVDVVVVSLHWGEENTFEVHPAARRFAHDVLDAGADVILGHHPHLPQGVEVRGGKVVFYSLGNLVFGHTHDYWGDNLLARLELGTRGALGVELLPVAGAHIDVGQPFVLRGPRAQRTLAFVQARCRELDTELVIDGAIGRVLLR